MNSKLHHLAETLVVLSLAAVTGYAFGRLQVTNFEMANDYYEAHLMPHADLARATRPPPHPARQVRPPCTIPRSALTQLSGEELSSSARIVPALRHGQTLGFRLFAVKPAGLFGKLGLRNGDLVRAINGFDLTKPDRALDAYARIKHTDRIVLDVERMGEPVRLFCTLH